MNWLKKFSPLYKDYRFWILQSLNIITFFMITDIPRNANNLANLNVSLQDSYSVRVFVGSYVLTAIVAAIIFGPRGAIATILLISIFAAPSYDVWISSHSGKVILVRLGFITFLGIVTSILMQRERSARKKLLQLNEILKENILEKEKYIELATEAQENERRRISRDLHDDTLQLLAAVTLQINQAIESNDPEVTRAQMVKAKETISMTSEAIRRYCEELRPLLLESLGLVPSIEWIGRELETRTGLNFTFETLGESHPIKQHDMIHIFRVMQEAFHNIEQHSKATAVRVFWNFSPKELAISVTDNGIGMWNFGPTPARSLGIAGMHERVELVGGKLAIESQPGFGTRISLNVPLE